MKVEKTTDSEVLNRLPEYPAMVLLIDDQPIVGHAVKNLLADEQDIDFHYCADPHQAVALATELRPTVILQDLIMPGMDGLQLVRMMRSNPATADTPIIVLSSREDPVSKRDAFAAGANDYLVKLPDRLELVARTRYHSRAHLNRIQRDEAYRALRESQQALLETNSRLFAANQELESATKVKSEFLATMSHEIRTPLSGVIGMTTLLSDTVLTREQQNFVDTIRGSGSALLELINDILDFSKCEAGKLEIENQPFDIVACIEETLDLLAVKAAEKNLALGYILEPSVPETLFGDVGRVRQVLMNIIGNAVKFTHQGEVLLHVFPSENQQGKIQFSVQDTGIGIPRNRYDRLFKSFSQVDRSTMNNFGGTGLGLAISKTLCEKMGGEIWVESEAGEGSTFHFTLTLAASDPIVAVTSTVPAELTGKKVLVIEDKPRHRNMLNVRLRKLGLSTYIAGNEDEAVQVIRIGPPLDAIILSSRFAGMSPAAVLDFVKQLRSERSVNAIPLVLLIPQQMKRLCAAARESGVSSFLYEPVREAHLKETLSVAFNVAVTPSSTIAAIEDSLASRFPLRILVAEDNPVNQLIAKGLLRKLGYQADMVSNGLEAISSLERQFYDLVFMDVQMPEMDGLEASHRIRHQWRHESSPRIVAMTANVMQGDREKCIRSGMDDYISKPVSLLALRTSLEVWGKRIHEEKSARKQVQVDSQQAETRQL